MVAGCGEARRRRLVGRDLLCPRYHFNIIFAFRGADEPRGAAASRACGQGAPFNGDKLSGRPLATLRSDPTRNDPTSDLRRPRPRRRAAGSGPGPAGLARPRGMTGTDGPGAEQRCPHTSPRTESARDRSRRDSICRAEPAAREATEREPHTTRPTTGADFRHSASASYFRFPDFPDSKCGGCLGHVRL